MPKKPSFSQIVEAIMIIAGVGLILASAFTASSYMAILGTAAIFWGVIMVYVTPTKHVPLTLMDSLGNSQLDNIERLLTEFNSLEKGVYIPPGNLQNIESSLIFIPKTSQTPIPTTAEGTNKLYSQGKDGLFITPPGVGLSRLLEKAAQTSFTRMDLETLQATLPKIFADDLEIAEKMEIINKDNAVTITIYGNVFSEICEEANDCPNAHSQVGCVLSSALACALAKATGKLIVIQNETSISETKTTTIEFATKDAEPLSELPAQEESIQEQHIASPSTPEIIVGSPLETLAEQATQDTIAQTKEIPQEPPIASLPPTPEITVDKPTEATVTPDKTSFHDKSMENSGFKNIHPDKKVQSQKSAPKPQEKPANLDLENLNKTIDEQEKTMYAQLAGVRQELEKLKQLTAEAKITAKGEPRKEKKPKAD